MIIFHSVFRTFQHFCTVCKKWKFAHLMEHQKKNLVATYVKTKFEVLKVAVSQDFWHFFISLFHSIWPFNKQTKMVSLKNLFCRDIRF